MRRFMGILSVVAVVAGIVVAGPSLAKMPSRVVTVDYQVGDGGKLAIGSLEPGLSVAQLTLIPKKNERTVFLSVDDDSGQPVRLTVIQSGVEMADLCAQGDPVSITPGVEIEIFLWSGPCGSEPGVATNGTLRAVFTRLAIRTS